MRETDTTIGREDADLGHDEPQWNSGIKAGTCVAAQLVVEELALVRQRGCSRMLSQERLRVRGGDRCRS